MFGLGVLAVELGPEVVVRILRELAEVELAVRLADEGLHGERFAVLQIDDGSGNGGGGLVIHTAVHGALGVLREDLPRRRERG